MDTKKVTGPSRPEPRFNIETRSIDYIPEHERHGKLGSQGPFWFLGNFHLFTISLGFVGPGAGLSAGWTALAGTLGIMFGTLFMAFHGSQGPEMGLPQMIQSRAQFGYRGVVLVLIATLFVFVGFNVVNISLIMRGLCRVLGIDPLVVACLTATVGGAMAVFGHDFLHRVFKWALMVSFPLYLLVTVMLACGIKGSAVGVLPGLAFHWIPFLTLFALGASYNITYAPYVSDYTRYLPGDISRYRLIGVIFLGASLSGSWTIGLGAWMAQQLGATDALVALNQLGAAVLPGCGWVLVMASVLGFLPVIALNIYSAMLTLLTGIDSFYSFHPGRRVRIVAIIIITGVCLWAVITLEKNSGLMLLNTFLELFLYFLVPWTAINLVDYFFVRRGRYAVRHFFLPHGIYGCWQYRGILAYVVGFIAMMPFFNLVDPTTHQAIFVGFLAGGLQGIDVAWLIGLAVSALVYLLLSRSLDLRKEAYAIIHQHDPHAGTGKK